MAIDLNALVSAMKQAATQAAGQDVSTFQGFAERQLQAIAQQTALVTTGIATGQITAATQEFFLEGLQDMALSFAKTLQGLVMVTVEKIWNAVVGVLWDAIGKATGIAIPAPALLMAGR